MTATPRGICTTSTTPATAFACVASNEATLPPKRGGRITTAVIIPGNMTSIANCCVPKDFARLSRRGSLSRPIILNWLGSFSFTSVGIGILAARAASSPNVAFFPDFACATTPSFTVISAAGTFHSAAAASTNMARAVAPACRSCIHELATAVEPPVPCTLPFGSNAKLPYMGTRAGELSTRI